jgi:hypothetical protein
VRVRKRFPGSFVPAPSKIIEAARDFSALPIDPISSLPSWRHFCSRVSAPAGRPHRIVVDEHRMPQELETAAAPLTAALVRIVFMTVKFPAGLCLIIIGTEGRQ